MFEAEEVKKIRRTRSRVFRGPYHFEEKQPAKKSPLDEDQLANLTQGKVSLKREKTGGSVALWYDPAKYGEIKAETFEEMAERHRQEIEELHQENEKAGEEAYQRGLDEGDALGYKRGRGEIEAALATLEQILEALRESTGEYFRKVENHLAEFAMMIARKVVGDTADKYREVAVRLAAEAIRQATERSRIMLIVNPVDLETLREAGADLRKTAVGIRKIEIESSDRIHPGGVLLETQDGSIDATIETMLDEVHKALKPGYEESATAEADDE